MQVLRHCIGRFIDKRRNHPIERNDFLSILLQTRDEDGHHMSDEQVMAECLTLFVAGHETTATAIFRAGICSASIRSSISRSNRKLTTSCRPYTHLCRPGTFALLPPGLQGGDGALPTCIYHIQAGFTRYRD